MGQAAGKCPTGYYCPSGSTARTQVCPENLKNDIWWLELFYFCIFGRFFLLEHDVMKIQLHLSYP
jgi:hypothetical protein